jgi:heat shock protein HtpX
VPPSAVTKEDIAIREGSAEKKKRIEKQIHDVGDIIRTLNGFIFLTCLCGLKLKIPPNYKQKKVTCPRCKRQLDLPQH